MEHGKTVEATARYVNPVLSGPLILMQKETTGKFPTILSFALFFAF